MSDLSNKYHIDRTYKKVYVYDAIAGAYMFLCTYDSTLTLQQNVKRASQIESKTNQMGDYLL